MVTTKDLSPPVYKADETKILWYQEGHAWICVSSKPDDAEEDSPIEHLYTAWMKVLSTALTEDRRAAWMGEHRSGDFQRELRDRIERELRVRDTNIRKSKPSEMDFAKASTTSVRSYPDSNLGLFERMRSFALQHLADGEAGSGQIETELGPNATYSDKERFASVTFDLLGLSDAEWLHAEALALQKEAVERATSLDRTLAYVNEKCAAAEKP